LIFIDTRRVPDIGVLNFSAIVDTSGLLYEHKGESNDSQYIILMSPIIRDIPSILLVGFSLPANTVSASVIVKIKQAKLFSLSFIYVLYYSIRILVSRLLVNYTLCPCVL